VSTGSKPRRVGGQQLRHSFLCGNCSTRFSLSSGQHCGKEDRNNYSEEREGADWIISDGFGDSLEQVGVPFRDREGVTMGAAYLGKKFLKQMHKRGLRAATGAMLLYCGRRLNRSLDLIKLDKYVRNEPEQYLHDDNMDRNQFLLQGINRETAYGIEIGPFYNPIAPKAKGWNTTIVDFTDTESLLRIAQTHSAPIVREMAGNIEPVDIVWRNVDLVESALRIRPKGFDYLIASHVIEHIPDIITFFQHVSALACDGFVLSLAVPDYRLTFDFFKPVSNTSHALLAYRENRTIHSPETMFDTYAYMAHLDGVGCWLSEARGQLKLVEPLEESHRRYLDYLQASMGGTQAYVDTHCWVFTPSSFHLMILELHALGYIDFAVTNLVPGRASEFLVQLKKHPIRLNETELQKRRLELLKSIRREIADSVRHL
jgi:hypothetical protein